MRFLAALLLAGCAAAPAARPPAPAPPPEPTYEIQLHRPARIGAVHARRTTMTSAESMVVKSGEVVLQQRSDEVVVVFAGTEKVLDVTANGTTIRSEVEVTEAFAESSAGREELLPAGSILMVARGAEAPLVLEDGARISPGAEKLLRGIFTTSRPVRTDDEIFGTATAQKVGATWPVRADAAARDLTEAGLMVDPASIAGQTALDAIEQVGEVECLMISVRLAADQITPPGLKPGDTVEKAHFAARLTAALPTDASRRRLAETSEVSAEIVVLRSVEGAPVHTEMSMKRTIETTYQPAR